MVQLNLLKFIFFYNNFFLKNFFNYFFNFNYFSYFVKNKITKIIKIKKIIKTKNHFFILNF